MRKILRWAVALVLFAGAAAASAAQGAVTALTCVGLYSETDGGYVSFRVGTGSWTVIKVGDSIPASAEIRVSVDRDWIELTPSDNPNAVYEMDGSESGAVTKSVADILKGTPRMVNAPKASANKADPAFKDKLFVTRYLGRQIYTNPDGDEKDVKYGDVLVMRGKVAIIGINNTITLMNDSGKVTTVIGPLKFDVEKVLKNEKLYQFLNVPR